MTWCTHTFPRATTNDGTTLNIPEAYPTSQLTLLHMHHDLYQHFPRAMACPAAGDQDPQEEDQLEKVGWRVGVGSENIKAGVREDIENIEEGVLEEDEKSGTLNANPGTYLGVVENYTVGFSGSFLSSSSHDVPSSSCRICSSMCEVTRTCECLPSTDTSAVDVTMSDTPNRYPPSPGVKEGEKIQGHKGFSGNRLPH